MPCPYIHKGGGSGTLIYCKSPHYCGGNSEQLVTGSSQKHEYCFGNYRTCPSYNNAFIGSNKSKQVEKNDTAVVIFALVIIICIALFLFLK